MSVSLSKGQSVSLRKTGGGALSVVRMGLGWQAAPRRGLFGYKSRQIDLDASAVMFAERQLADHPGVAQHEPVLEQPSRAPGPRAGEVDDLDRPDRLGRCHVGRKRGLVRAPRLLGLHRSRPGEVRLGVAEVFTPGSPTDDIVEFLRAGVATPA